VIFPRSRVYACFHVCQGVHSSIETHGEDSWMATRKYSAKKIEVPSSPCVTTTKLCVKFIGI